MKGSALALVSLQLLLAAGCGGGDGVRRGSDLSGWPRTGASQVEQGFAAMLLVTPDRDWRAKWDTSPETIPRFDEVSRLRIGEQASILTFFTNPQADASNQVRVLCDLKGTRPDESIAFDMKDIVCVEGELTSPATDIWLSPAVIEVVGEDSDPLGVWRIEVRVKDMVRGTAIDLKTSFELVAR